MIDCVDITESCDFLNQTDQANGEVALNEENKYEFCYK